MASLCDDHIDNIDGPVLFCEKGFGFRNAIEFANAIDRAAKGGATSVYIPPKRVVEKPGPNQAGGDDPASCSLEKIAEIMKQGKTHKEQVELACGLPCVLDKETDRMVLAPTASIVLKFQIEAANKPLPVLNLGASPLYAMRVQAAKEANKEVCDNNFI